MRTSVLAFTGFAAVALAGPIRRDVVVNYAYEVTTAYVTDVVVVNAPAASPDVVIVTAAPPPAPAAPSLVIVTASPDAAPTPEVVIVTASPDAPAPTPEPQAPASPPAAAPSEPVAKNAVAGSPVLVIPTQIIQDLACADPTYTSLALAAHNAHRRNHTGTNDLTYDMQLQRWAEEKAQSCIWDETT